MGTPRWYCVRTKPRKEKLVLVHLDEQDIPAYRPLLKAPGPRSSRVVPLFPNYLFVQIGNVSESVGVRYTPGVSGVLGYGDEPFPVDDEVIALIRSREGEDGAIRPRKLFRFTPEQRVRLRGGSFNGLEALFRRYLPGKQRVQVLLQLMGRHVPVQLGVDQVLPINM